MRFDDQVVLITGAANGIPKAAATGFLREGATVVALDMDAEGLARLRASGPTPSSVVTITTDLLREEDVREAVRQALAEFGRIDVLVNAVGGSTVVDDPRRTTDEMSLDYWERIIAFNVTTTFLATHYVLGSMKQRRSGKIVNVSSYNAYGLIKESGTAYAAAKAAVIGFTRRLAVEAGPYGINVNAIAPAASLTDRVRDKMWNPMSEEGRGAFLSHIPLGRLGSPEDQANGILFLSSSDADYIQGAVLDINGGCWSTV